MAAPTTMLPLGSVTVPFNWALPVPPWANIKWTLQKRVAAASRTRSAEYTLIDASYARCGLRLGISMWEGRASPTPLDTGCWERSSPDWGRCLAPLNVRCQRKNVYLLRRPRALFGDYSAGMYAASYTARSVASRPKQYRRADIRAAFYLPQLFQSRSCSGAQRLLDIVSGRFPAVAA